MGMALRIGITGALGCIALDLEVIVLVTPLAPSKTEKRGRAPPVHPGVRYNP
jgi:hypothetical protein